MMTLRYVLQKYKYTSSTRAIQEKSSASVVQKKERHIRPATSPLCLWRFGRRHHSIQTIRLAPIRTSHIRRGAVMINRSISEPDRVAYIERELHTAIIRTPGIRAMYPAISCAREIHCFSLVLGAARRPIWSENDE